MTTARPLGMLAATMGILKTITDELRRVQAERETQDLLEVLRRQIDVLTFGDLAGLVTSALGKSLAAVKVSALLVPPTVTEGATTKTPAASTPTTAAKSKSPSKKPRPAAGKKKGARKSKSKSKAKAPSKGKAPKSKKASKQTNARAKGKKTAAKAKASTPPRSSASLAAQDAVLRTLAASAEPLGIRGVFEGAKLSQSQATRTLRGLVERGKVRMIGPKQRATYALTQGTGSGARGAAATPSPASAPASSTAAGSSASVTAKTTAGREAYSSAILTALQQAGDWTGAADLRPKVGGTREQLRLGLVRLLQAKSITKTGERNNTRYKLVG